MTHSQRGIGISLINLSENSSDHGNRHPAPLSKVESEAVAKVKSDAVIKSFH